MLWGRAHELARIDELIDGARRGAGGALLLDGEPGIGKTALVAAAAARAGEGMTVVRATGSEASTAIPYAGLRQLVEPLLELRERLPPVQAQALGVALALEPPTPQARLAVPLALVALLGVAGERWPVLALVDDLQWLDPASREAIVFAARRLGALPVALLLAARDGEEAVDAPGVDRLPVGPLDGDSARAVLRDVGGALSEPVREAVAKAAAGNPLALLELPAGLTRAQRAGRAPLELPLRLGPLLQRSFARQVDGLDADARRAITVAAALERGPLSWLLAALARLELPARALDAGERTRVVRVDDGRVELRHPLMRVAAYYAAAPAERRAAHRALAATAPAAPLRAWHLAAAADDSDAGAADALEAVAREARAVGGHAEAAAAFERAAELSATAAARGLRELEAAADAATAGDHDRALALLDAASGHAGEPVRAAVARLRGNLAIRRGEAHRALRELTAEGERQLAAGDGAAAAALFLEASVAPFMTGEVEQQVYIVERARRAAAGTGGEQEVLVELVAGEAEIAFGREARGRATLAAAVERLDAVDLVAHGEIVGMAAQTSLWSGDFDRAAAIADAMVSACRRASALGRLTYPLAVRAQLAFRRGGWSTAAQAARESVQVARETGQETLLAFALAWLARVDAAQGRGEEARAGVAEALAITDRERADGIAIHAHAAAALAALVAGRADAAVRAAERAAELEANRNLRHPAATMWAAELIDAQLAAGRAAEARAAVDALAARARETGSRWAAAVAARGALALAPDAELDERARTALAAAESLAMPFELARTELAIGERLRRAQRRAEARRPLARALAGFERLGAAPFAARSRVGLDAAPATAADAVPLTPQERQIARLVADGRTNREIAAALHLGEKTLERRLTRLYRKAGVGSRTELARALAASEAEPPA
nr:LuxR family transcriptional regulator [Conexibacter arvalis]